MKDKIKCSIIGGGIAGLTLANAFKKHNIRFKIYERMPDSYSKGLGIWLGINAISSLNAIDLADKVLEKGVILDLLLLLDKKEKVIARFDLKKQAGRFGFPAVSILRSDLQEILLENLDEDQIEFDKKLVDIRDIGNQQLAVFEDSSEVISDLIVGADGIKSICRKLLFPNVSFKSKNRICFRGVSNFIEIPEIYRNSGVEIWGNGSIFGFSPLPNNQIFWWAVISYQTNSHKLRLTTEQQISVLKEFDSYPLFINQLIHNTPPELTNVSKILSVPYLKKWYKNNTILIGDAAHGMEPNLGQGGSMAIENAVILANSIKTGKILNAGFSTFLKKAYLKVYLVKYISQVLGKVSIIKNQTLRAIFNILLKFTPQVLKRWVLSYIYKSRALDP